MCTSRLGFHVDMQCGVGSCVTEFPILFCMHVLSCTRCQGCKLAIHIKLDYPSLSYSIVNIIVLFEGVCETHVILIPGARGRYPEL